MNIEHKKLLIKSKSSNAAIVKENKKGGFSSSYGAIPPSAGVKKRGVYVERTVAKSHHPGIRTLERQETVITQTRDGKASFLTSVLSILTNSTANPQFPMPNMNLINTTTNTDQKSNENRTRKPVYKSKILNNGTNNDEDLIVLKKHKIESNPSNMSTSNFSSTNLESVKSIANAVCSSKKTCKQNSPTFDDSKNEDFATISEPATLVGSQSDNVYNLFVDLLTTSLKDEKEDVSNIPSKHTKKQKGQAFEIESAVADKLRLKNISSSYDQFGPRFEKKDYEIRLNTDQNVYLVDDILKMDAGPFGKPAKRKKPKKNKIKNAKGKLPDGDKMFNKQEVIKMLKKELTEEIASYEEPNNFYDALTAIAATKRQSNNWDKIPEPKETDVSSDDDEDKHFCSYKLPSLKSKKSSRKVKNNKKASYSVKSVLKKINDDYAPSYTDDFDFNDPPIQQRSANIVKFEPETDTTADIQQSDHPITVIEMINQNVSTEIVGQDRLETEYLKKSIEIDFSSDSSISNISFGQTESFIEPSDTEIDDFYF